MRNFSRKLSVTLLCALAAITLFAQQDNPFTPNTPKDAKAVIITCSGMIDEGLFKSIKRRAAIGLEQGADYIIFEIDTFGGRVDSAAAISDYLMLELAKKTHTVAFITAKAISAGAYISVSCNDIIMLENTTIGDCAPILMGGKLEGVEREKGESFLRAAFTKAAETNNYPAALLKAMVTMQIEVYRVKNKKTGEFEFLKKTDLPEKSKIYDLENKKLIVTDTELLTLTANEAFEYGIARAKVESIEQALSFLEKRDSVTFTQPPVRLETTWSENMVRWINSPAVMGVLVMLAVMGVYIEFQTPGLGLAGLAAVVCFTIIISSKYLTGLANWLEVALFVVGLLLIIVEVFITPGFGFIGGIGIIFIFAGIFGMLVKNPPDKLPWPKTDMDWQIFHDGLIGLLAGLAGFGVLAWLLSKFLPRMQAFSGLILVPQAGKQQVKINVTAPPNSQTKLEIGQTGLAVTTLHPAGKAKFADSLVDVVAQSEFIDKDEKVRIIDIKANKVVVNRHKE